MVLPPLQGVAANASAATSDTADVVATNIAVAVNDEILDLLPPTARYCDLLPATAQRHGITTRC
jgi:hypothetical protein